MHHIPEIHWKERNCAAWYEAKPMVSRNQPEGFPGCFRKIGRGFSSFLAYLHGNGDSPVCKIIHWTAHAGIGRIYVRRNYGSASGILGRPASMYSTGRNCGGGKEES